MEINEKDVDFSSLLIKRYTYYKLSDLEVLIILVSDKLFERGEKILLTRDILSKHMSSSKDELDTALNKLIKEGIIEVVNDNNDMFSSIATFKKRIYSDLIKDIKLDKEGSTTKTSSSLFTYIEQINNRVLSQVDRDYIYKWSRSGISDAVIKEACMKSKTKGGYISFKRADSYILEVQRSTSRKEIGVSTVDEKHEKNNMEILMGDWLNGN